MTQVLLKGTAVALGGEMPALGQPAPPLRLTNGRFEDRELADFGAQPKLLSLVPSLDTPVCAESTRVFHRRVAALEDCALLVISADLPFAQQRFCSTEGIAGVHSLSTLRAPNFGRDYGALMVSGPLAGLLTRAVLVLDADNRVIYREWVSEITQEPDYDAAIAALSQA